MAIQITERQHFVPRTYLKNFSEKKGSGHYNIMVLPKSDLRPEAMFERNTKSICYEKNLYTQPGSTAEEQMLLEKFYSEALEAKYGDVYSMLIDPNKVELSDEERELVISTVATMYYRVPRWIKQHTGVIERVFRMCIQATEHTGQKETKIEGDTYLIAGKTVEQLVAEYVNNNKSKQVITQLKVAIGLIDIRLKSDNIFISKLEDGDQQFITSDNPVILQNLNGADIIPVDPSNIMKLPLDGKHCLMLMPNQDKSGLNRISRHNAKGGFSRREELLTNSELLQGADEYVLGSNHSLGRFLQIRNQEIVLTQEEQEFERKLAEIGRKNGWL